MKPNYPLILGWLFVLSFLAIPITWMWFSSRALAAALIVFGLLLAYQVVEAFVTEYRIRHSERQLRNTINESKTRKLRKS